jgi:hypothetical protein
MKSLCLLLVVTAAACAGDSFDEVDPVCTFAPYDVCSTEHDCLNEICTGFADFATPVCSAICTTETECPPGDGVTCVDNRCKPAAPTACTRPLSDAGVPP